MHSMEKEIGIGIKGSKESNDGETLFETKKVQGGFCCISEFLCSGD